MRFEEPIESVVANFPEFRVHRARETVPYVTHVEIAQAVARGRRLHAHFCRQAASTLIARPVRASARWVARVAGKTTEKLRREQAVRATIKALARLDDSQLRDVGVRRSDILYVARTLAYANRREAPSAPKAVEPSFAEDVFEHARAA